MSVDELAEAADVSVRTVRYYQSTGLVPPPHRHGRTARYDEAHLDRLRLVADLQQRGLRLSAIAELFERVPDGSTVEWLGLGEVLERPWSDDRPQLLAADELQELMATIDDPDALPALEAVGLVERRDDTVPVVWLVPSPAMLDVVLDWVRAGLDVATVTGLAATMRRHLAAMADELVARFTEEVSLHRLTGEGPGALAALLEQARPLTRRALDVLVAHEMERATRSASQPTDERTWSSP